MKGVDLQITEWARTVLPGVPISLDPPSDGASEVGLSLFLFSTREDVAVRNSPSQPAPLRVFLRYLVTTAGKDAAASHDLFAKILFASLEHPTFRVTLEDVPPEAWLALRAAPRPGFVIEVPLVHERPHRPVKYVREIVIKGTPVTSLAGQVVGPGDVPLVGAAVELPSLSLTTRTDVKGQFRFASVPPDVRSQSIHVRAKGREVVVSPPESPSDGKPWLIRFPDPES